MKNFSKIFGESFFVIFLFLTLAIILTFPSILSISSHFIGDGWDNYEYASYQMLIAKEIREFHYPFVHTDYWRYPVGFDLSRGFDSHLTVVTGALLDLVFGMPLAYNLTVIFLLTLNGILSFIFFFSLTRSRLLGILGAIIYGSSFYVIAKAASHPNLMFVGGFPLLAYSILKIFRVDQTKQRDFFLLFGAILLIALGSLEYLVMSFMGVAACFLILLKLNKALLNDLKRKIFLSKEKVIAPFITFVIAFLFLYFPYFWSVITGSFVLLDKSNFVRNLSPLPLDYVLPNSYLKIWISNFITSGTPYSIEKVVFIGWVEILILVAFLLFARGKISVFLGGLSAIFLILSFGDPFNFPFYPYHFLINIPPFSSIAEAGRFAVVFGFFMTCAVIYFLNATFKKKPLIILLLILLCLIERLPSSFYIAPTLSDQKFINEVKKTNTKAVLDLPVNLYYSRYNMLSIYYDKPIVNGYFHWPADGAQEKAFITDRNLVARYTCSSIDPILTSYNNDYESEQDRAMIELLRANGVNTIVVHKDDKFFYTVCRNVRLRLARLFGFEAEAVPTPDNLQKQIAGYSLSGAPNFKIFLPYEGKFYVDGVYFDPSVDTKLQISLNYVDVNHEHSWTRTGKGFAQELTPQYTLNMSVVAGSIVSFHSEQLIENSAFSLWYRYIPSSNFKAERDSEFEKVFEDDRAIVYKLK